MNQLGWGISAMSGVLAFAITHDIFSGLKWFSGVGLAFFILIYIASFAKKR